jgi:hypothetical protein
MVESKSQKETFTSTCLVLFRIFKYTCQFVVAVNPVFVFENKLTRKTEYFACYNHPVVKLAPDLTYKGDMGTGSDEYTHHFRAKSMVELLPGAEIKQTIQFHPDKN